MKPAQVAIRAATPEDVPSIAAIYGHAVLNTVATLDTEEPTTASMSEWLSHHDAAHPVIVASVNGETLGWGSLSAWSPKGGYRTTAEASVYVAPAHHGSGIGTRLLQDLIARARSLGVHVIVARISTENRISLQLVSQCGFTPVGTMRESGFKFDRYVDVEVLQLVLTDGRI